MSAPAPARRNVECKATDPDPARSLEISREIGACDHGVIWQRDTYFHVAHGGLKLREETPGRPHLVQFERANKGAPRPSHYRTVEVGDAAGVSAALTAALGLRGVIEKRRGLFVWEGVRIHLDAVEDLGSFIELEAVAPADSDLSAEHALVARLRETFAIGDDRLCATGYADQLLGVRSSRPRTTQGT